MPKNSVVGMQPNVDKFLLVIPAKWKNQQTSDRQADELVFWDTLFAVVSLVTSCNLFGHIENFHAFVKCSVHR
jgi:hypothetical protein